ncbi:MAG: hypothetical protein QW203_07240 [Thermoplasmatales archaeon]
MSDWITITDVRESARRNLIYLTQKEAKYILSQINQDEIFKKHKQEVRGEIWDGKPINGVDVSKGLKITRDIKNSYVRLREFFLDDSNYVNGNISKEKLQKFLMEDEVVQDDPTYQFIKRGSGHAYIIYIDEKISVFQPFVPYIQGFHALTHKTILHPVSKKIVDKCETCGQEHDVVEIMNDHITNIIKSLASTEIMTKVLYMAQEIYDKRMDLQQ